MCRVILVWIACSLLLLTVAVLLRHVHRKRRRRGEYSVRWHHGTPTEEKEKRTMDSILNMTDTQHCAAGVTIKDRDGKVCTVIPSGTTVVFDPSTDPKVAEFVVGPDGMNGDMTSGDPGTCSVASHTTFPDGTVKDSVMTVNVLNSEPASADFTPGVPQEE
jgi:hypothetical protein